MRVFLIATACAALSGINTGELGVVLLDSEEAANTIKEHDKDATAISFFEVPDGLTINETTVWTLDQVYTALDIETVQETNQQPAPTAA